MASPFPGMDPYLEDPRIWSGIHSMMLAAISEQLAPILRPSYFVRHEERVYVMTEEDPAFHLLVPDVRIIDRGRKLAAADVPQGAVAVTQPIADHEIHEGSLKVVDSKTKDIVTVIELLSPTNKVPNSLARANFLKKRREIMATDAHWMEIDLLRDGARTANLPGVPRTEYLIYLSRAGRQRQPFAWPMSLRKRLPIIQIPLKGDDPDVPLDLQSALDRVVERGSYDLENDYTQDPIPPLAPETAAWARERIAAWTPPET